MQKNCGPNDRSGRFNPITATETMESMAPTSSPETEEAGSQSSYSVCQGFFVYGHGESPCFEQHLGALHGGIASARHWPGRVRSMCFRT